jgi:hypothetical protein
VRAVAPGAVLLAMALGAANAQGTIRGRVLSARTGEAVAGASVFIVNARVGAIADSGGSYVITGIPAGTVAVRARFIGFVDNDQTLTLADGETRTLDFRLADAITTLNEVRTEARVAEREVFEERPNLGVTMLSGKVVSTIPRLGEPDVLRAAQMLPGVLARNDFTAGLNVRGGEADQNQILLDGYPIFNPFHLGGLFGTFIDGSIDGLELRTGGFPAPYGGRLSSVLNVKSLEENRSGIHGTGTLSMLATSGTVASTFGGGKGNWVVGARRTYADKVLGAFGIDALPYFFRDGVAHGSYRPATGTEISTTLYSGRDDLTGDLASANDAAGGGNFKFFWGNRIAGVTVRQRIADSLQLEQRASYTTFSTELDLGDPVNELSSLRLHNNVVEKNLSGSLAYRRGAHTPSAGYTVSHNDLVYTAGSQTAGVEFLHDEQHPTSAGGYVNDIWKVTPRLVLEGGLRYETLMGSGWTGVSPRLASKFFLTPNVAVTAAVGRYSQWLHSLAREDIPVRLFDFWTASDSGIPVSRASHFVAGTEAWFGPVRFIRLESYVKQYDRLLEPNVYDDPDVHGDEHVQLTGRSYGLDLLARQLESGRWSGWLAYTYTYSVRHGNGATFYPGQDRRNNLNVLMSYRRSSRTQFSARFGYASGTPYTDILSQMPRRIYDINTGQWDTERRTEDIQPIPGERNALRLPATQRFDVSVTREMHKGVNFTPFLSIINLYNAKNVFMYTFNYQDVPATKTSYSQLPFLPTFGVSIQW